jgi:excisionase family DNA binding protein
MNDLIRLVMERACIRYGGRDRTFSAASSHRPRQRRGGDGGGAGKAAEDGDGVVVVPGTRVWYVREGLEPEAHVIRGYEYESSTVIAPDGYANGCVFFSPSGSTLNLAMGSVLQHPRCRPRCRREGAGHGEDMSNGGRDIIAPAEPKKLAVDVNEAAKLLSISVRTVWREVDEGRLKVKRVGSRVVFSVKALQEWLEQ